MHFKAVFFLALTSVLVDASTRDHLHRRTFGSTRVAKRATNFPPILDDKETILVNSFDNTSISDWSYYYTHGLHLAGKNRSMAQWTADKWSEYGIKVSAVLHGLFKLPCLSFPIAPPSERNNLDGIAGRGCAARGRRDFLPESDTYFSRVLCHRGRFG
jgi:hypothetical protein